MPLTKIDDRGLTTPVDLQDNEKIRLGTGNDLEIFHDGTDSTIKQVNGGLHIDGNSVNSIKIRPNASELSAQFVPNGAVNLYYDNSKKFETTSGGVTVTGALTATGATFASGVTFTGASYNTNWVSSANTMRFYDNAVAGFGNADDLKIYHDGTNSLIRDTGNGYLKIDSNGSGIYLTKSDGESMASFITDGAVELFHNGSKKLETTSGGVSVTGTITSTDSANVADGHVLCQLDSGNGRLKLLNGSDAITVDIQGSAGNVNIVDNGKFQAGSSNDLQIFHDGTHSRIHQDGTGYLIVQANNFLIKNEANTENLAHFIADGAVELNYDGSKKFETYTYGVNISGTAKIESGGNFHAHDNVKFIAGTSEDLQIFHDGSNSRIAEAGTGYLIQTSNGAGVLIQDYASGQNMAKFLNSGACELYHNYSKKIETTSYGTLTTGESRADNFQVLDYDGSSTGLMKFGAGDDLKIYHDGTDNIYQSTGLKNHIFKPKDTDVGLKIIGDGGVELYYDNAKKLATESTGVAIEGKMHSGHDMPNVGQTSFHTVDQAVIGTKHVLTAYHNSTSTSNSPLALNSVIPTNSAGEITIIAGWSNGNGLRIRKFSYVASGSTSVSEIYNHFNSRYGVSVSISTPTPTISGDYVNFSIGFSDSQGAKVEKLKVHVEYFKQFNI